MKKIEAFYNHGRWIAPTPGKVNEFFAVKPGDRSITFPDNWREIVEVLRPRPVENMNWMPGETLEDLRAENFAHGVGPTLPDVSIVKGGIF